MTAGKHRHRRLRRFLSLEINRESRLRDRPREDPAAVPRNGGVVTIPIQGALRHPHRPAAAPHAWGEGYRIYSWMCPARPPPFDFRSA